MDWVDLVIWSRTRDQIRKLNERIRRHLAEMAIPRIWFKPADTSSNEQGNYKKRRRTRRT